jgi:hypothetical protein
LYQRDGRLGSIKLGHANNVVLASPAGRLWRLKTILGS